MIEINFTALHTQDSYTLQIGDPNDGGTTEVEGMRDVFTTTEDDDTDVFMPVRCTSGTVKFYNPVDQNGESVWGMLADLSDEHKPVTLLNGNAVVWSGFINKGYIGTRKLYGYNEECEICVQCPLSELDTVYYSPSGNDTMVSVMDIITDILDHPFGNSGPTYTVQISAGIGVGTLLNMYVNKEVFMHSYENDSGSIIYEAKYTRKQALEEMMKLICCSARWTGTAVEIKEIQVVSYSLTLPTININTADTESSETAVMPCKKVVVTAEADADGNDAPISWPTSQANNWAKTEGRLHGSPVYIHENLNIRAIGFLWGDVDGTHQEDYNNIDDDTYNYSSSLNNNLLRVVAIEDRRDKTSSDVYSLSPSVWLNQCDLSTLMSIGGFVKYDTQVDPSTMTISTKKPFFIRDAILSISMRLKRDFYDSQFDGEVQISVKIGDLYWDYKTGTWLQQTNNMFFPAYFEAGQLKRNGIMNIYYDDYDGYGIEVDGLLEGVLEISVKAPNFTDDLISIDSLDIRVVRHLQDIKEKNRFTANGSKGSGENETELIFCSERRSENAINFLYFNNSGEYIVVNTFNSGEGTKRPEQFVADRRAMLLTDKARSLIILRQIGQVAPGRYGLFGKTYETISINHDWAENITEAHLIEIS